MKSIVTIEIKIHDTVSIGEAYVEAIRLATLLDICIEFNFNNVKCLAFKNGDVKRGVDSYWRELSCKNDLKVSLC